MHSEELCGVERPGLSNPCAQSENKLVQEAGNYYDLEDSKHFGRGVLVGMPGLTAYVGNDSLGR